MNTTNTMTLFDTVNRDLLEYANGDNERSIPDLMDGLKRSQRKALFTQREKDEKRKVSVLASFIAARTLYKHGETSMMDAVIGLAQHFTGANNMPLLEPLGQFGNRMVKVASAPRYIYTKLSENSKVLLNDEDDCILDYLTEEGETVEPARFFPLLPILLINGNSGIGVGFASNVMPHKPSDVKDAVLRLLKSKKEVPSEDINILPWFTGFDGTVRREGKQIVMTGIFERVGANTIHVTSLPPGHDNTSYKVHLNKLVNEKLIKSYTADSNEEQWMFVIDAPREFVKREDADLLVALNLVERNTQNITVETGGRYVRYESEADYLREWVAQRIDAMESRRLKRIEEIRDDIRWNEIKRAFIMLWIKNGKQYCTMATPALIREIGNEMNIEDEKVKVLLDMSIRSMTQEHIERLERQIEKLKERFDYYDSRTAKQILSHEVTMMKV